jgi:hypothetical protein
MRRRRQGLGFRVWGPPASGGWPAFLRKLRRSGEIVVQRPRSFHIQRDLESYVEDFADVRIALDRLRDPRGPAISGRALRKSPGLE